MMVKRTAGVVKTVRNTHEVLTNAYGDYMTLPDEDDRVSHHDIIKVSLTTDENESGNNLT